jgi:hypothetical protein
MVEKEENEESASEEFSSWEVTEMNDSSGLQAVVGGESLKTKHMKHHS